MRQTLSFEAFSAAQPYFPQESFIYASLGLLCFEVAEPVDVCKAEVKNTGQSPIGQYFSLEHICNLVFNKVS